MKILLVVLLLPLAAAAATPAAPKKPSKEEAKRFRAAMAEGRKAGRKNEHAAAAAAFERASAIKPGDPKVLSELGWETFLAKDLDKAEKWTRAAIAAAHDNTTQKVKAASLYNLGRILEAKAQKPAAAEAYLESLRLRPSRTVREQLATIDPKAAADADPLKPTPMLGPFATLEAVCAALGDNGRAPENCPDTEHAAGEVAKPGKPWLAVRYFEADDMCHVAVRIAAGWFVETEGFFCFLPGHLDQTLETFAVADVVPGGSPEVVLRLIDENMAREDVEWEDEDGNKETGRALMTTDCDGNMRLCGLGPSGRPSCAHFPYGKTDACAGKDTSWTWELKPSFAGGQVDFAAEGKPSADAKALMGKRAFAWP